MTDTLHEDLIFIICTPRSGSTLLQRMLASHSEIFSHPEPHLITPLAYLGYYDTVQQAPYDHVNAAQALRELAEELPRGEDDYLDALRAYASTIYGRVLAPTGKRYFLDKTPAYALVWRFLTKLYPRARYVVLTRHPMGIMHSVAYSFFNGDYKAAQAQNPIVEQYVPEIGAFLAESPVDHVHVRYEDLVSEPEAQMRAILAYLGLSFEPEVVHYGAKKHITKSYGDPFTVDKHDRPMTSSMARWAQDLAARPEALQLAKDICAGLNPEDLARWGYPLESLFDPLNDAGGQAQKTQISRFNSYRLKRQVLLSLRRNVHDNVLGELLRKIRYYCDVLLRT